MRAASMLETAKGSVDQRALLTLMAFAAGDAFGVAYEYAPDPLPVDMSAMATRADWPLGGVSDDTLLSLLTIFAVTPDEPAASSQVFIERLRQQAPQLRGMGPTTRAALGMDVNPEHVHLVGNTNGGMMRTSLLGLGYTPQDGAARRAMVTQMARATHQEPSAVTCALLCSRLYSEALTNGGSQDIHALLRSEAVDLGSQPTSLQRQLASLETWCPSADGVPLEPGETLLAVTWVTQRSATLADAFRLACELGGDTDTVAALAGGLIAARHGDRDELLRLPWIDQVLWSEIPEIVRAAEILAEMRGTR